MRESLVDLRLGGWPGGGGGGALVCGDPIVGLIGTGGGPRLKRLISADGEVGGDVSRREGSVGLRGGAGGSAGGPPLLCGLGISACSSAVGLVSLDGGGGAEAKSFESPLVGTGFSLDDGGLRASLGGVGGSPRFGGIGGAVLSLRDVRDGYSSSPSKRFREWVSRGVG